MILEELLEIINDNMIVKLFVNTEEVASYDGKDSIDEIYNNCDVYDIWCDSETVTKNGKNYRISFIGIDISEPEFFDIY